MKVHSFQSWRFSASPGRIPHSRNVSRSGLESLSVLFGSAARIEKTQAQLKDFPELGGHGTLYHGVVVLDGRRTPFGDFNGALKHLNETDLAVVASQGVLNATGIQPEKIRDSIWGNVIQSSQEAAFLSRNVSLRLGVPVGTTATTVNKLCGSGLKAIDQAALEVATLGDSTQDYVVLAGGTESMSNAPFASFKLMQEFLAMATKAERQAKSGAVGKMRAMVDFKRGIKKITGAFETDLNSMAQQKGPVSYLEFMNTLREGLSHKYIGDAMLDTAENLRERYQLKPEELDRYSVESHHWHARAVAANKYADEIVPVKSRDGMVVLAQDELNRNPKARGMSVNSESLQRLRDRQGKNSPYHLHPEKAVHTAANASRIVDGAAALLVTNQETASRLKKTPLGNILATGEAGVNPHIMGLGAAQAAKIALKTAGMTLQQMDLVEINEAFAGVALASIRELAQSSQMNVDDLRKKTNINGGAIAIGHPLGATGARLVITMMKELQRQNLRYGLVTACIGGGQGIAAIVENPAQKEQDKKPSPLSATVAMSIGGPRQSVVIQNDYRTGTMELIKSMVGWGRKKTALLSKGSLS